MSFSRVTGKTDSAIHTSPDGLRHGMVNIPTQDGTLAGYYAAPADAERPPVLLVVQEIFGLHEHIKDVCRRYAHAGYFAVALELYQRQGDATAYDTAANLIKNIVAKVPDEQVMADLDASAEWAASQGADDTRLGVTGFCWGGRIVWLYAAHQPKCKAGVAWYGRLVQGHGALQTRHPIDVAAALHAPVLGLYGGKDTGIPQKDVAAMREALGQGGAAAQASRIDVYPDADHAFYADYRPSYHPSSASDAWRKSLDWLASYLR